MARIWRAPNRSVGQFSAVGRADAGIEGNGTQPASVSYRLTIPADAPLGVAGIRVATGQGISNVRLVLVDDLPSRRQIGNNKTPATAQPLTLPIAVDGACDAESSDFYKITVAAGQRMSVEVFARRLGSPLDPMIRLLSADGRELAYSDDEPSTGADSRFSHTFAAAGDYFWRFATFAFREVAAIAIDCESGDFPLPSVPYPLAVQKGTSRQRRGEPARASELPQRRHGHRAGGRCRAIDFSVAGRHTSGQGACLGHPDGQRHARTTRTRTQRLARQEHAGQIARRDRRTFRDAAAIATSFSSRPKRDSDCCSRGQTRSLGSPSDLFMRLYNAEGGVLAEAEDTGTEEGVLNVTFPADGIYRLRVEDTNHRGGADEVYRISVRSRISLASPWRPPPKKSMRRKTACSSSRSRPRGATTTARSRWRVEGAGEGCTLRHNVIPEGKPETTLHVTLGPSLAAGQLATIKIVGTAKIGETEFAPRPARWSRCARRFSGLPFPPAVLDGTLALGVGPVFPQFFQAGRGDARSCRWWPPSTPATLAGAADAHERIRRQGESDASRDCPRA